MKRRFALVAAAAAMLAMRALGTSWATFWPRIASVAGASMVGYVLPVYGVNGVFQDGREAIVSAGQFVLYDTTRPYELRFDDSFSQTIFQMPRKLLQQRVGSFDGLTATTFAGDRPLEPVGRRDVDHLAAADTQQVVMVIPAGIDQLIARGAIPEMNCPACRIH